MDAKELDNQCQRLLDWVQKNHGAPTTVINHSIDVVLGAAAEVLSEHHVPCDDRAKVLLVDVFVEDNDTINRAVKAGAAAQLRHEAKPGIAIVESLRASGLKIGAEVERRYNERKPEFTGTGALPN